MYTTSVKSKHHKKKKFAKIISKLVPIFKKSTSPFAFNRHDPSSDLRRVRTWIQHLYIVLQSSHEFGHVLVDFENGGKINRLKDRAADVALYTIVISNVASRTVDTLHTLPRQGGCKLLREICNQGLAHDKISKHKPTKDFLIANIFPTEPALEYLDRLQSLAKTARLAGSVISEQDIVRQFLSGIPIKHPRYGHHVSSISRELSLGNHIYSLKRIRRIFVSMQTQEPPIQRRNLIGPPYR